MIKFTSIFAILLATGGCAAEADSPVSNVVLDGDDLDPISGKADGVDDIQVRDYRGGSLVTIYGPSAANLWDIMEESGIRIENRRGLEYAYGNYMVCVTNRSAAACQVYSEVLSQTNGDYAFTIHGPRFRSAASELFGTMAAANGVDPRRTSSVENGAYICEKTASSAWCGLNAGDESVTLEVSLVGLGDLGSDFVYEGWLITPEGPIAAGRFSLSSGSETASFTVDADVAAASTMYVLTIEPAFGDEPGPSSTHIVAGEFNRSGQAELTTLHPGALGTDFTEADGGYILETPSSADAADYGQGVWFVNPAVGAGSLHLPTLPNGWAYEGWVVGADGPVSTGTFTSANAADSDEGGPAAGPNGTPPFPGQDFISPAMSVIGATVVISVEPSPDNSPAPFFLKPLVDGAAEDVGPGTLQGLGNNAAATAVTGFAAFN